MKKAQGLVLVVLLISVCLFTGFRRGKVVKIGVVAPITGNLAEYGKGFDVSTRLAVDKVNAAGGVKGKKIELVLMDSKGDAKESAEIARKFSQDQQILAVIGDFSSTCCMAGAPIYQEAGLVQISPTASHPDFAKMGDFQFGTVGRQDDEGPFMAKYVAKKFLKAKKVAVIYINNDWGLVTTEYFKKAAQKEGVKIVATEAFFDGEKDFNALLTKLRQTNPDTLCFMMQYNEAAIICRQIKQMGWNVKIMAAGSLYSEKLIQLGGKDVEGLISESPFIIEKNDKVAIKFANEFTRRAGFQPNIHATSAYDTAMLVADAMKRAVKLDRKSIRNALKKTKNFKGISGPITFNKEQNDVHRKYRILTIKNGEWIALTDYDYYQK
jgi:branched-chain amino acid transport system substrate-binding protein